MFNFIKKLFGFDQATMKEAGVQTEQAPYKVETPPVLDTPLPAEVPAVETATAIPEAVNNQITDAVTQSAPAKKERKPRAQKPVKEKAAKPKKPSAMTAKKPGRKPKSK